MISVFMQQVKCYCDIINKLYHGFTFLVIKGNAQITYLNVYFSTQICKQLIPPAQCVDHFLKTVFANSGHAHHVTCEVALYGLCDLFLSL